METIMPKAIFNASQAGWKDYELMALKFLSTTGRLWLEKSVEIIIFRQRLFNISTSALISRLDYGKNVIQKPIEIEDVWDITNTLTKMDIYRSRIDVGTLAYQYSQERKKYSSMESFLKSKLKNHIGMNINAFTPKDVVLFGLGRIGRMLVRELAVQTGGGQQLNLRAIVTRGNSAKEIVKRASLILRDSVHGKFPGVIREDLENNTLIINGNPVKMIASTDPSEIDYTTMELRMLY